MPLASRATAGAAGSGSALLPQARRLAPSSATRLCCSPPRSDPAGRGGGWTAQSTSGLAVYRSGHADHQIAAPSRRPEDHTARLSGACHDGGIVMVQTQPSCGDPLRVDDQTLKGDLEDKAKFLSSLVGNANLKGQIEATRTASSANTQTPVQLILMLTSSICSAALYRPTQSCQPRKNSMPSKNSAR
jgi:hypothetical protein